MSAREKTKTLAEVVAIGITQTIAWASSTYLIAIVARPVARDLGTSEATVFGAFSVALVVMAAAGPPAGRAIDAFGGRGVLATSNAVLAAGLALLGVATDVTMLFAAWCVIGAGMALGLYDAAFATLVRLHGEEARAPITGITLIAGFASTVGWPLTAFVAERYGWRASCHAWAVLHLALALPVNLVCIPKARRIERARSARHAASQESETSTGRGRERRDFALLAVFAALTAFVTSAMAAHLPGLLVAAGTTVAGAIAAGALLGPAQVVARVAEFIASRRYGLHPLSSARVATACHPVAAALLGAFGGPTAVAVLFAMLHGAGNGLITIAKGTLPLAIFGASGYGHRQGLLGVLSRGMQALAPYAFGLVLERGGATAAIALSAGLSIVAWATLLALRAGGR